MTIKEIVLAYLTKKGYDGLAGDNCGCELSDLMPCCGPEVDVCEAGHKEPCPGGDGCYANGDHPWHIVPGKKRRGHGGK